MTSAAEAASELCVALLRTRMRNKSSLAVDPVANPEGAAATMVAAALISGQPTGESVPFPRCYHCGTACRGGAFTRQDKAFCCQGCLTVYELLTENGLGEFYALGEAAGVRIRQASGVEQYRFLDELEVRERMVDFSNPKVTCATCR